MKKFNIILIAFLLLIGIASNAQSKAKPFNEKDYALFGDKFKVTKIISKDQMLKKYKINVICKKI